MKIRIILFSLLGIILILSSCSCKSDNKDTGTDGQPRVESVSNIELTIPGLNEKVVELYDDGNAFVVHYFDYEKSELPVYERKYYLSGNIFIEGELLEGNRTGKWIAKYENGQVWSVANYEDGKNHGSSMVYFENGQLRYNKEYINDVPHGLWKFYSPEGVLLGEVMYEDGEVVWENDYME